MFVVRDLRNNLLGLPAIEALQLVTRIEEIKTVNYEQKIRRSFPRLFRGLGNLGEPYRIQLRSDAKPKAIYTPRRVPFPLRARVKQELDRMESLQVISKVDEATQWCAGMVVVPKKNGAIRVCVDLKPLNESVVREIHPIPTVEESLAHLNGAAVFSKIDANSGSGRFLSQGNLAC